MLKIEQIAYAGWQHCYRLSNERIDLVVTTDVGPRIIRFGFVGEDNQFFEMQDQLGKVGGNEWRLYGGHRLWHAPEHIARTYCPDNEPVQVTVESDHLMVVREAEPTTGIQKEMRIYLHPEEAKVRVVHLLKNCNLWSVNLAPWALSVMAAGGKAIVPLPPKTSYGGNLLPVSSIALWEYTNLADPRWDWGKEFVMLEQDKNILTPQKAGFYVPAGWVAYAQSDALFIKSFVHDPAATYPDNNSNVELFTNADLLEVETLGALASVAPGESVKHEETWFLEKVSETESKNVIDRILERAEKEKSNGK